jgi:hypothetical protein
MYTYNGELTCQGRGAYDTTEVYTPPAPPSVQQLSVSKSDNSDMCAPTYEPTSAH